MRFEGPEVFLLLVPLGGLVALAAWRGRRALSAWRRSLSALVRLAMAAALLFGLARPIIPQSTPLGVRLVFVLDVSRSVAVLNREGALARMASLLGAAPAGSSAAMIRFAGAAEVYRNPLTIAEISDPAWRAQAARVEATSPLDPSRTDLRGALDLARGLIAPDGSTRVVVATDGNATEPIATASALASFRARGTPVFVLPMSRPDPSDAALTSVSVPEFVEPGLPFDVSAVVRGAPDRAVVVHLLADGREVARRDVSAGAANAAVTFEKVQLDPGKHAVAVEIRGDDLPENDRVEASVEVRSRPRVLVVGHGAPLPLAAALAAQDFDVEATGALQKGEGLAGLDAYSAIVLLAQGKDGEPAPVPDAATAARLRSYVADFGGGLLVFGGPRDSRLESLRTAPAALTEILPLEILEEPPEKPVEPPEQPPTPPNPNEPPKTVPKEKPVKKKIMGSTLALVLAIDKSGSMRGEKIELAKASAIASSREMDPEDYLAVLAFDSDPHWVLPMTQAGERGRIETAIGKLQASDGTRFIPTLEAARDVLLEMPVRIRHIILLSDGESEEIADFRKIAADLAQQKITLSTIGIGEEFDSKRLGDLALYGGGRFDCAFDFKSIPAIVLAEVGHVVGQAKDARDEQEKDKEKKEADLKQKAPQPPIVKPEAKKPETMKPDREPPKPRHVRVADESVILRGVEPGRIPSVARVNPTKRRFPASVAMETEDGQPLLAHWSFGLGRVVVFASDSGEVAAPDWPAWEDYPKLWGQVLRYIRRVPESVAVPRRLSPPEPAAEDRRRSADRGVLDAIAAATGGMIEPTDAAVTSGAGSRSTEEPLGFGWLLLALLLVPIDVAIRRLGV